jgi:hypothetical protein
MEVNHVFEFINWPMSILSKYKGLLRSVWVRKGHWQTNWLYRYIYFCDAFEFISVLQVLWPLQWCNLQLPTFIETNVVRPFLAQWLWLQITPHSWQKYGSHGDCDRSTEDPNSSSTPDPTSGMPGDPCLPINFSYL